MCLKNLDHKKNLTISPSSPPKSKNNDRVPSSAEPFSLSNEYDQITLAGVVKLLSTSENPLSKCTINWHGRLWTMIKKLQKQKIKSADRILDRFGDEFTWYKHRNENSRW